MAERKIKFIYNGQELIIQCKKEESTKDILQRYLNKIQKQGWKIGIISWGSKNATDDFLHKITISKIKWLRTHLKSVTWNEIKIVPYGTNKFDICGGGILFDDEEGNRNTWGNNAFSPSEIISVLKGI